MSGRYGQDAPGVTRSLGTIAFILVGLVIAGRLGWLPHMLKPFQTPALAMALTFGATSIFMWFSSKILKLRLRDRVLGLRSWSGDERVIDVGCGAGLLGIGAAKRLGRGGSVVGLDLWRSKDLSGNAPDAALRNARLEEVADRFSVETGDMQLLPFADNCFDVAVSMTAIHNIPSPLGREKAIAELWRVLKPGGQVLVFDIFHARRYSQQLRLLGASEVQLRGPFMLWLLPGWIVTAVKS